MEDKFDWLSKLRLMQLQLLIDMKPETMRMDLANDACGGDIQQGKISVLQTFWSVLPLSVADLHKIFLSVYPLTQAKPAQLLPTVVEQEQPTVAQTAVPGPTTESNDEILPPTSLFSSPTKRQNPKREFVKTPKKEKKEKCTPPGTPNTPNPIFTSPAKSVVFHTPTTRTSSTRKRKNPSSPSSMNTQPSEIFRKSPRLTKPDVKSTPPPSRLVKEQHTDYQHGAVKTDKQLRKRTSDRSVKRLLDLGSSNF